MVDTTLTDWVDRQETSEDSIDEQLVNRLAATFDQEELSMGEELPALWHWAFFQTPALTQDLALDGHAEPGIFLPPNGGRGRMWAGGRLDFHHPLRIGQTAHRHSKVLSISEKQGRSGALLFVTVQHTYWQAEQLCLKEEQDIVYKNKGQVAGRGPVSDERFDWSETWRTTTSLLFRYSAMTFNSHRIHYDLGYAAEEGYEDLVVHGPLLATLALQAANKRRPDAKVRSFAFRNQRPLYVNTAFDICGLTNSHGSNELCVQSSAGIIQTSEITYQESSNV